MRTDSIRKTNIKIIGIPKGEESEEGTENLVKQIGDENFPNLWKGLDPPIQEATKTPNDINTERPSPKHVILKLSRINDQERILKVVREKKRVNY